MLGASDSIGARPSERPVSPADIHASMFAALGHDSGAITYEMADGGPMGLTHGSVLRELV